MPRPKNDTRPRGRVSAYAFFVQTCRAEYKKNYPDRNVPFSEFSKWCAARWKAMTEQEKRKFHLMADQDKARFEMEMKHYAPAPDAEGKKSKRGKKHRQTKDPNAPKRSLSAFFWFCNDERPKVKAKNPDYPVGEVARELGKMWAHVEPELKRRYEIMAQRDKDRYLREMTEYKKRVKLAAPPAPAAD